MGHTEADGNHGCPLLQPYPGTTHETEPSVSSFLSVIVLYSRELKCISCGCSIQTSLFFWSVGQWELSPLTYLKMLLLDFWDLRGWRNIFYTSEFQCRGQSMIHIYIITCHCIIRILSVNSSLLFWNSLFYSLFSLADIHQTAGIFQ